MEVAAVGLAELTPGMQHRQHQFQAALLVLGVDPDRDAAAIVADGDRVAALVERNVNVIRVAVDVLVNGVVEDFPDQVVQALGVDAADVHGGPLANRLQAFEDLDVLGAVPGGGECTHP